MEIHTHIKKGEIKNQIKKSTNKQQGAFADDNDKIKMGNVKLKVENGKNGGAVQLAPRKSFPRLFPPAASIEINAKKALLLMAPEEGPESRFAICRI